MKEDDVGANSDGVNRLVNLANFAVTLVRRQVEAIRSERTLQSHDNCLGQTSYVAGMRCTLTYVIPMYSYESTCGGLSRKLFHPPVNQRKADCNQTSSRESTNASQAFMTCVEEQSS